MESQRPIKRIPTLISGDRAISVFSMYRARHRALMNRKMFSKAVSFFAITYRRRRINGDASVSIFRPDMRPPQHAIQSFTFGMETAIPKHHGRKRRATVILDNLIAQRKAVPMIVVMLNGYPNNRDGRALPRAAVSSRPN
jgi:hypothetical protein